MMNKRRLLWRLFMSYMLIASGAVIFIFWYGSRSYRNFYLDQTAGDLQSRGQLLKRPIIAGLLNDNYAAVDSVCKDIGDEISTRITVILPDGRVIGDSETNPSLMDNHGDRPEVQTALEGRTGRNTRFSHTLSTDMLYVALPLYHDNELAAVLRTAFPLTSLDRAMRDNRNKIAVAAILLTAIIAVVSLGISRKLSKPLEDLKAGAERFAAGDLGHRLRVSSTLEIEALSESMNRMAAQLDERIRALIKQRYELEAVLTSMGEGVIAVDPDEKIMSINRAAVRLFGIDGPKALGRSVHEVIRNPRFQEFVAEALTSDNPAETDIDIIGDGELSLRILGTPLVGRDGERIGAVIVVEDVTRLRKLEIIRRDFVANVSHELKTPITSIKGYLETIADDKDANSNTVKFLQTAIKQTDRLNDIIDDLLSLATIEEDSQKERIALGKSSIYDALASAVTSCGPKARDRNVELRLECPADIVGRINAALLQQAVINLIDNAINYSDPGSDVEVTGTIAGDEFLISVKDRGPGIESVHLDRIFERFYRVDKSRSRKNGGTGLGLAIVKHIAQAHGGRVDVISRLGQGSTFYIIIPVSA